MENVKELGTIALGKAAGEVSKFVGQFQALMVVAAALEEAGGLERRLESLRRELEEFPVKRRELEDGIVKAAEITLSKLRAQAAGLIVARDSLLTETEAARRELSAVSEELESKRDALKVIEGHVATLKEKLG